MGPGGGLIGSPSRGWAPSGDAGRPWLRPKIPPLPLPENLVPVDPSEPSAPQPGARRGATAGDQRAPGRREAPVPAAAPRRGPRTPGGFFGWRGWRSEGAEAPHGGDAEPASPGAGTEQATEKPGSAEGVQKMAPADLQAITAGVCADPSFDPSPLDASQQAYRRRLSQALPASPVASGENLFFDAESWRLGSRPGSVSRVSSMATTDFASAASEPLFEGPDGKPNQAPAGNTPLPGASTAPSTAVTSATPDAPKANGCTDAADKPAAQAPLAESAAPAPLNKGESLGEAAGGLSAPAPAASELAAGWGAWRVHPRPARGPTKPQAQPQTLRGSKPRSSTDGRSVAPADRAAPRQSFWRTLMGAPALAAAGRAPAPPGSVSEAGSTRGSGAGADTEGAVPGPCGSAAGEQGPGAAAEGGRGPSESSWQDAAGSEAGREGGAGGEGCPSASVGGAAKGEAELGPEGLSAAAGQARAPDTPGHAPGAGGRAAPDQALGGQTHAVPDQALDADEALDAEGRATQLLGRASAARAKARRLQQNLLCIL